MSDLNHVCPADNHRYPEVCGAVGEQALQHRARDRVVLRVQAVQVLVRSDVCLERRQLVLRLVFDSAGQFGLMEALSEDDWEDPRGSKRGGSSPLRINLRESGFLGHPLAIASRMEV